MSSHNDHLGSGSLQRPEQEQQWVTDISYADFVTGNYTADLNGDGTDDLVEPSALRADGIDFEHVPGYNEENWWRKMIGAWLIYLDSKVTGEYGELVVVRDNDAGAFEVRSQAGGPVGAANYSVLSSESIGTAEIVSRFSGNNGVDENFVFRGTHNGDPDEVRMQSLVLDESATNNNERIQIADALQLDIQDTAGNFRDLALGENLYLKGNSGRIGTPGSTLEIVDSDSLNQLRDVTALSFLGGPYGNGDKVRTGIIEALRGGGATGENKDILVITGRNDGADGGGMVQTRALITKAGGNGEIDIRDASTPTTAESGDLAADNLSASTSISSSGSITASGDISTSSKVDAAGEVSTDTRFEGPELREANGNPIVVTDGNGDENLLRYLGAPIVSAQIIASKDADGNDVFVVNGYGVSNVNKNTFPSYDGQYRVFPTTEALSFISDITDIQVNLTPIFPSSESGNAVFPKTIQVDHEGSNISNDLIAVFASNEDGDGTFFPHDDANLAGFHIEANLISP